MDNIDITNPEFSLSNLDDLKESIFNDYSIYIIIALVFIVIAVSYYLYNKINNRPKHVTFQDKLDTCYGNKCYTSVSL
jgi:hypothetical protein